MDIGEIQKNVAKELKKAIRTVDSVRVVPPEELKSNDIYPQAPVFLNEEYLIVRSAKGYNHMEFTQVYDNLPNVLQDLIRVAPHKVENESDLILGISIDVDYIDRDTESLNIKNCETDVRGVLDSIIEDYKYIHGRDLIDIIDTTSNSATIDIHKDLLMNVRNYGETIQLTKFTPYSIRGGLTCVCIEKQRENYYRVELRPSTQESIIQGKEQFLRSHFQKRTLLCPDCQEHSAVFSEKQIVYCTSCNEVKGNISFDDVDPTQSMLDLRENWINYISDPVRYKYRELSDDPFIEKSNGDKLYLERLVGKTLLNISYTDKDLRVYVKPSTKSIYIENEIENNNQICLLCAEENTNYKTRIDLSVDSSTCTTLAYLCEDCKKEANSKIKTYLEKIPNLDQKMVIENI